MAIHQSSRPTRRVSRRRSAVTGLALAAAVLVSGCGTDRFSEAASTEHVSITHSEVQGAVADLNPLRAALDGSEPQLVSGLDAGDILTLLLLDEQVDEIWVAVGAVNNPAHDRDFDAFYDEKQRETARAELEADLTQQFLEGDIDEEEFVAELDEFDSTSFEAEPVNPALIRATETAFRVEVLLGPDVLAHYSDDGLPELVHLLIDIGITNLGTSAPGEVSVNPRYGEWDDELYAVVPSTPDWIVQDGED